MAFRLLPLIFPEWAYDRRSRFLAILNFNTAPWFIQKSEKPSYFEGKSYAALKYEEKQKKCLVVMSLQIVKTCLKEHETVPLIFLTFFDKLERFLWEERVVHQSSINDRLIIKIKICI